MSNRLRENADADFIIIGSGAGGGPLAANLARAGHSVLLLEAGGDPCADTELGRHMYEVPVFHGLATEYPDCQWDYFVRHYTDDALQHRDRKFVEREASGYPVGGVWYPRAGTLGGCTAHNAMITVTPQDRDWNAIAEFTGDKSWRADNMHRYYERLENCHYRPRPGSARYVLNGLLWSIVAFARLRRDFADWAHGHGFGGWLTTSAADPRLLLRDKALVRLLTGALKEALKGSLGNPALSFFTQLDPNDLRNAIDSGEGLAITPLAVANGKRNGPREFLLRTQKETSKLKIQMRALAKKIIFEGTRAIGVEYYDGPHVYEADPAVRRNGGPRAGTPPPIRQVLARREVILCGGAFNSPQLLKLSGIGPYDELKKWPDTIPRIVNLPGVGENLQDRYEVGVITEFKNPFVLLKDGTFAPPSEGSTDKYWQEWMKGKGVYATNGALLGILKRSQPSLTEPDLFIFGLPGFFKGYFPGFSKEFERQKNRFTWAVLKAYTENTAGRVTLRSDDARDWPLIEFKYFSEGSDRKNADLDGVVDGVEFVRRLNKMLGTGTELVPGPDGDTPTKLRQFIADEAWGHHASCTNRIGPDHDEKAVLNSRFEVRGTTGLRVVDASVFPRIPGYFIVTPTYMISEKAFDVIANAS